jgi:ubiquinone biosynthesis protein Coq4
MVIVILANKGAAMTTVAFNQQEHDKVLALPARERWRKGLLALKEVAQDTSRTDRVLYAYEHLNAGTERARADRFYRSETMRRMYEENRTLDASTVDFAALERLPDESLGHAYARFMRDRGITPDIFASEGRLTPEAYIVKRIRQTHDLWHTVVGAETDVAGELELQAFSLAQLWAPSLFVVVIVGALKALFTLPKAVPGMIRGFFRGLWARPLFAVPWEDLWEAPLQDVRAQLKLAS